MLSARARKRLLSCELLRMSLADGPVEDPRSIRRSRGATARLRGFLLSLSLSEGIPRRGPSRSESLVGVALGLLFAPGFRLDLIRRGLQLRLKQFPCSHMATYLGPLALLDVRVSASSRSHTLAYSRLEIARLMFEVAAQPPAWAHAD